MLSPNLPRYQGPVTDHFDGNQFQNLEPKPDRSFSDVVDWQMKRELGTWQMRMDEPQGPPPPERVEKGELRVTFINHATILLQVDGVNLLTDPIYSDRCSPLGWIGPKRHRKPGIRFRDLPPIDAVLISHNHYDHLDLPTLKRLSRDHDPLVLLPLGCKALLDAEGISGGEEYDWWQSATVQKTAATFVPAQHWSGRSLGDERATLWGGWVIQSPHGSIYYAGDTADGPHFQPIAERFGPFRLSILPIGAYVPRWFMSDHHMAPEEAVDVHRRINSQYSVACHFGTFPLADDGMDEPVEDLRKALRNKDVSGEEFWVLNNGEAKEVPPLD